MAKEYTNANGFSKSHSPFHQVILSTAKQQYSFPKETRFPKMKSTMCSGDYTIKSAFEGNSKAGSGFGHGKKFMDVEKKTFGPEPVHQAYTFGNLCNSLKKVVVHNRVESVDPNIPGPGTYQFNDLMGKGGWKVALGKGNKDPFKSYKAKNDVVPGPGEYDLKTEMRSTGLYYTSNFKNVNTLPFKPSKRFKDLGTFVPGPGNYDINTNTLVHSEKNDQTKSGFGKSLRKSIEIKEVKANPGPGFYQLPSTFGEIQSIR